MRLLRPLAMPDEVAANDALRAKIDAKKSAAMEISRRSSDGLLARWKTDEARYRAAAARFRIRSRGTSRRRILTAFTTFALQSSPPTGKSCR